MILVRVGSWEAIPKPNKDEQHLSILWQIKQNNAASQTVADFKHSTGNQGYFRHPCMSSRNSDQYLCHLSSISEYSWSVIKLSKNVPYVQFKYRFMLLFFYAIQLLIFFSLNNFSSLHHLSKYFRQSQLFRFLHVLLEIRISIYCMNFIFSEEDLSPYLIKSFPKRLSLSLCHIISLNSELYFPNRFFIDKNCCLWIH